MGSFLKKKKKKNGGHTLTMASILIYYNSAFRD